MRDTLRALGAFLLLGLTLALCAATTTGTSGVTSGSSGSAPFSGGPITSAIECPAGTSCVVDSEGMVGKQEDDGSTDPTGMMLRPGACDPADATCAAANLYLYGGQDTTTIAIDGADPSVTCAGDNDTVTVYICGASDCDSGTVLAEGTEWTASASVEDSCTSLASALDALSGVSASCTAPSVLVSLGASAGRVQLTESTAGCTTVSVGARGGVVVDPDATVGVTKIMFGGTSSTNGALVVSGGGTPSFRAKSANSTAPGNGADGAFFGSTFGIPPSGFSGNTHVGMTLNQGVFYAAGNNGWGALSTGLGGTGFVRTVWTVAPWTNDQVVALGAATSGEITIATMFPRTRIKSAIIVISTQAAGTTTLTVSAGRDGTDYDDYVLASDAQVSADTVYGDAKNGSETGANLFTTFFVTDLPSWTASTPIHLQFVSTGANLDQVTGSTGLVAIEFEVIK